MHFSLAKPAVLLASLASVVLPVAAQDDGRVLRSSSLNTCQENSGFQASLFNVVFTPHNGSANVNIVAVSSVQGSVMFDVTVSAYGYEVIRTKVNPCDAGLAGLCPMTAGKIPLNFNLPVSQDALKGVPGITYSIPDLDATIKLQILMTDGENAGKSVACVEADISNGKTVDLLGVKWATALIAGLALCSSAIISGFGHQNAASHVAANALSLFGYFQSQAMLGLTGISLPPIVSSWSQDFAWSMGIINVDWMQRVFTWYQRATGGTPSTIFDTLTTTSVQVEKRSLDAPTINGLYSRSMAMMPRSVAQTSAVSHIAKRANIQTGSGSFIVFGIQRVAFKAGIETTNIFLTGLTFFCIFVILTVLAVAAFKGFCELAVKRKWMKPDTFLDFRNGWFTVLKGILFRMTLIGFPSIAILCLWEFTQRDSPALVVLAVFFFFGMIATLGWATFKVIRIARRSVTMHHNPAYILFSDPQALNKWGFLYVQFRASAYYFIVPILAYVLLKAIFIAFAQRSGIVQAVAFILIEAGALIAASVLRPWMDKSTNSFNIAIHAMNFVNSIFLLIFTDVFNPPRIVIGAVGVVLWVANAVFALVLLIMLIVTTVMIFIRKNPDTRYQAMADDRASFMKSQTHLNATTELDALAATARGDKAGYKNGLDLDDDADSISSDSLRRQVDPQHQPLPASSANSVSQGSYSRPEPPRSPVNPSMPLFPVDNRRPGPQQGYGAPYGDPMNRSPSPYGQQSYRSQHNASPARPQTPNGSSPWQRGAGYDH